MKIKILAILVTALMTSCVFAGAAVTKNNGDPINPAMMWGSHERFLYPPWNENDCFTQELEGDVEVTASADNENGYAQSKCEIGWTGTEEGEAGFSHWFEWTSPVTTNSAVVDFNYYCSGEIKMVSSWGSQGDVAKVKIWLRYFVDDTTLDVTIIDWMREGGIDDEYSWNNQCFSRYICTPLEKGKTYRFGVETFAYSYATFAVGSSILSRATITHNQDEDTHVRISWEDRPPAKPSKPSGPTSVNTYRQPDGVECTYTTSTTDPDMEQIYYQWYFGDTGTTSWLGPYPQGQQVSVKHTWKKSAVGTFDVKVKAKGSLSWPAESDYSEPLKVTVEYKRSKDFSSPFLLQFLERLMDRFPHLKLIFPNLG